MDAKEIRNNLLPEQIIQIYQSLGGVDYKEEYENGQLLFSTICHSGNSLKLYYYIESKSYYCYTHCSESFDVFELVQKVKGYSFSQSISYICNLLGIQRNNRHGFITNNLIDDWDIINKYDKVNILNTRKNLKIFDKNILNFYSDIYHQSWIDDGISVETMEKYLIKFDINRNKIIIPHLNQYGDLVGIRCRNLNEEEVEAGKKYMPVYIQGDEYKHPLALNLYGFYQNQKSILRTQKIIIFESEKSCLQVDGMFADNNFAVACCGSSISNFHRDLILSQNVREVFIAFDKQFKESDTAEAYKYAEKLKKIAAKFCPYVTTYILYDDVGLLAHKQSPSDCGKEVLLELMKHKYEIITRLEE